MALRPTISDCVFGLTGPAAYGVYFVKTMFALLAADFWNYWKHRLFHGEWLWAFHKIHHKHHNPTCYSSFSTSVLFGIATFGPIYLFAFPETALYAPIHLPVLLALYMQNFYLHC